MRLDALVKLTAEVRTGFGRTPLFGDLRGRLSPALAFGPHFGHAWYNSNANT